MTELEIKYGRIRQGSRIDTTGAEVIEIVVPIHIGNHGPFTERFTLAEWEGQIAVRARIDRLKAMLAGLPSA
jgi:hypothetical protein